MKTLLASLILCGGLLLTLVSSEARHRRHCCCQCGPVCNCVICTCPCCPHKQAAVAARPACGATCTKPTAKAVVPPKPKGK
jgi:hypothetical protein